MGGRRFQSELLQLCRGAVRCFRVRQASLQGTATSHFAFMEGLVVPAEQDPFENEFGRCGRFRVLLQAPVDVSDSDVPNGARNIYKGRFITLWEWRTCTPRAWILRQSFFRNSV